MGIPTGTVGAIAELGVAIDLLRKGFHVFRALSPNCSCDLAIVADTQLYRVEVKTGHRDKDGHPSPPYVKKHKRELFDIIATVLHDTNEIIYTPALPIVQIVQN